MNLNKLHKKISRAGDNLLGLIPDLSLKTVAEEAGKISKVSFNLTLLDVLDDLVKRAIQGEPMPWEETE